VKVDALLFSEDFRPAIESLLTEVVLVVAAVEEVLVFQVLFVVDEIEKAGIDIFVIDEPPPLELLELLDGPRLPPPRAMPTPDAPAAAAPGIVARGIIIIPPAPMVDTLGDDMDEGPLLPPLIAEGAIAPMLALLSVEDEVIKGEFRMTLPIDCNVIADTTLLPEVAIPDKLPAPSTPVLAPLLGILPECIGIVFAGQDALGTEAYTGPKLAMDCPMS
jgi:hypothetical protein